MIIFSAIKFYIKGETTPIIMTGKRHSDIFERMHAYGMNYDRGTYIQGFWTNEQQFLNRVEAKAYALKNGQLEKDTGYAELYSEDLW